MKCTVCKKEIEGEPYEVFVNEYEVHAETGEPRKYIFCSESCACKGSRDFAEYWIRATLLRPAAILFAGMQKGIVKEDQFYAIEAHNEN